MAEKRPRKKKAQPKPAVTTSEESVNPDIQKLLSSILAENIESSAHRRDVDDTASALISTLKEFLDSFVVLGYDMDGEPMIISYSQTSMGDDALRNLMVRFMPTFLNDQNDLGFTEEI